MFCQKYFSSILRVFLSFLLSAVSGVHLPSLSQLRQAFSSTFQPIEMMRSVILGIDGITCAITGAITDLQLYECSYI